MSLNSVAEPTFELEENVMGSMILNKKCFDKAIDKGLQPEDFEKYSFKKCFELMLQKQTQDILLLKDLLKNDLYFDDVRLASVHCITHNGFDHWLKLLFEKRDHHHYVVPQAKDRPRLDHLFLTTIFFDQYKKQLFLIVV